ncbi:MAG TPA: hypothetical protein VMU39_29760 [Solirubrobacteraceae bacterium]|nr:hypothetical protein [Solirubrobacteraceae bacterium]
MLFNNAGLVTGGLLEEQDIEQVYGRHLDTSGWGRVGAGEWADHVLEAVKPDRRAVEPGGKARLAVIAARGPSWLLDQATARVFSRTPRQ